MTADILTNKSIQITDFKARTDTQTLHVPNDGVNITDRNLYLSGKAWGDARAVWVNGSFYNIQNIVETDTGSFTELCLQFDGTSFGTIPSDPSQMVPRSLTVACWIKPTAAFAAGATDIVKKMDGAGINWSMRISSHRLMFYDSEYGEIDSGLPITLNVWNFIAITASDNHFTFFRDAIAPVSLTPALADERSMNDGDIIVGLGLTGFMDKLIMNDYAVSDAEIATYYSTMTAPTMLTNQYSMIDGTLPLVADQATVARPWML